MIVIPAVDIKNGRCVRLFKGRKSRETVYEEDPLHAAERWASYSIKRMHVVDLDGAFEGRPKNMKKVTDIIRRLRDSGIECEVGGGIRNKETVAEYAQAGAARIVIGTVAVTDEKLFSDMVAAAPGKVNLALDCRGDEVVTRGWETLGGVTIWYMLKRVRGLHLAEVIYTDVERDGTGKGIDAAFLKDIVKASPFPVVASGGVGNADDVRKAKEAGAFGVIIGKALYDGKVDLKQALEIAEDVKEQH